MAKINETTRGTWPPTACAANPGAWCEASDEHAMHLLGAVPPIYFPGGFAVGEAQDMERGHLTYLCFADVRGTHFARVLPLWAVQKAIDDLLATFATA